VPEALADAGAFLFKMELKTTARSIKLVG